MEGDLSKRMLVLVFSHYRHHTHEVSKSIEVENNVIDRAENVSLDPAARVRFLR